MFKALLFGGAGFALKWCIGSLSARASDIRQSLALLDKCSNDAERVMWTIQRGAPDVGASAGLMSDRTALIVMLRRALGHHPRFGEIETSFSLYAFTLRHADPHLALAFGQDQIDAMRLAQVQLRQTITAVAADGLAWQLFQHQRLG